MGNKVIVKNFKKDTKETLLLKKLIKQIRREIGSDFVSIIAIDEKNASMQSITEGEMGFVGSMKFLEASKGLQAAIMKGMLPHAGKLVAELNKEYNS